MVTFEDIATQQGWNAASRLTVLRNFVEAHPEGGGTAALAAFAQAVADEENGVPEGSSGKRVPDLQMDLTGEYTGHSDPAFAEYRLTMTVLGTGEDFGLTVEDSSGAVVNSDVLDMAAAEGVIKMSSTDHDIGVYEDDWKFPAGMRRTLTWEVGGDANSVVLNEGQIDEVAQWLRYATGEDEWDWAENGSEWEF